MGQREIILDFINQITVKKAEKAGVSKVTLYRLEKANKTQKLLQSFLLIPKNLAMS